MTKQKGIKILSFLSLLAVVLLGALAVPDGTFSGLAGTSELNTGDMAWMLTATGLVLLMTPGLSFFYGGMVQKKNIISTMFQSFVCLGICSILWVAVGFSLAFGDSIGGLIGDPRTFFMFRGVGGAPDAKFAATIPLALFALFQLKFAIITPALITGAFAEHIRFRSYVLFTTLFSIFVYCPLAHWTWHPDGFLRKMGVLDFAGGTVVHMSAGLAALAGALFIGRRELHKNRGEHVPANIPYILLGTGLLWFGWFGFNAGSALGANTTSVLAFLTTNTASATALVTWMLLDVIRGRKPNSVGACIGAVVGLVAITPAAGFVNVGGSIRIGALAAFTSYLVTAWKNRTALDDTLDVFPCHGVGGMVGMVATGVFATTGGLITGETKLFFAHLTALAIVSAFAFAASLLLYYITNQLIPIRVESALEDQGLDLSQHGEAITVGI